MVVKLKENTGKSLEEWISVMAETEGMKKMELVKWLRSAHGLKNSTAYLLMAIHFNGGELVYANVEKLLEEQYHKNGLRDLYESFNKQVLDLDSSIKIGVCKGYTSYLKDVQFMITVPKPKEIRVGLALGNKPFEGKLEKAKSLGANEKIGHQFVIQTEADINQVLLDLIKEAYMNNLKSL